MIGAIDRTIEEMVEEIKNDSKSEYMKVVGVALANAFLFSISAIIGSAKFVSITKLGLRIIGQPPDVIFTSVFTTVFVGSFFVGFILHSIMEVLGGKGSLLKGVSSVVYSVLPVAIGTLVASTTAYIPLFGPVISYASIFLLGGLGYAILYRMTRDLFDVNMITTFVGISLVLAAGTGAFYASFLASTTDISTILRFIRP